MLKIDDRDIKEFEADLKTFARRAYPFATKGTINGAAFGTQKQAKADVRNRMTLRNRFTEQSIRVEQSRTLRVSRQSATVGSIVDYMADQEFGGLKHAGGKYGTVVPTSYAAGQGMNKRPRTRLPTRVNKLANIRLGKKIKRGNVSRRQEAFLRGLIAANQGDKFVFIPGGGGASTGIYRVWGRQKKRGRYTRIRLKMVYSMKRPSTVIPRSPWLGPAVAKIESVIPRIYLREMKRQAKRHNLFRGR